jgi:hypothetical protein
MHVCVGENFIISAQSDEASVAHDEHGSMSTALHLLCLRAKIWLVSNQASNWFDAWCH